MFCIIFFKTIPNILLLLFLSPEFNKICLNEERNCIAETNILNKSFEVSFNIYVWWYIYILKQYNTFWRIHCICQLYSLVLQVKIKESQSIVFTKWCRDIFGYFVLSCFFFYGRAYSLRYRWYTWESSIKRWLYWFCKCIIRWLW